MQDRDCLITLLNQEQIWYINVSNNYENRFNKEGITEKELLQSDCLQVN